MGRTACTEPQCLYKGDLYLYISLSLSCKGIPCGLTFFFLIFIMFERLKSKEIELFNFRKRIDSSLSYGQQLVCMCQCLIILRFTYFSNSIRVLLAMKTTGICHIQIRVCWWNSLQHSVFTFMSFDIFATEFNAMWRQHFDVLLTCLQASWKWNKRFCIWQGKALGEEHVFQEN